MYLHAYVQLCPVIGGMIDVIFIVINKKGTFLFKRVINDQIVM